MSVKRRYLPNFEARSVALFATMAIGGALGGMGNARAQFSIGPGTPASSTSSVPASQTRTHTTTTAPVTPSTDKRDTSRKQAKPSS